MSKNRLSTDILYVYVTSKKLNKYSMGWKSIIMFFINQWKMKRKQNFDVREKGTYYTTDYWEKINNEHVLGCIEGLGGGGDAYERK